MSGRHRGDGARGISTGVIIVVLIVLLLVLSVFGWFRLRDRIDRQGVAAAETCVEGDAVLHVAADPLIAPALATLAERWSADATRVIRDHCITAQVTAGDSTQVALALEPGAPWNAGLGPEPALWVPIDSRSTERAVSAIDGQTRSLATSPIVLAVPDDLGRALTSAAVGWDDIPSLQSNPAAMSDLGLDMWGPLSVALPTGARTDATAPTLEAVAAAVTGAGTGPLTLEQAESPAAVAAVSELALGANTLGPTAGPATADALTALGARPDTSAPVHAVPVVEQQLYTATDNEDVRGLTGYLPLGPTPIADFPAAVVKAPWVDETLSRAASEFLEYLRRPEQVRTLVESGFRVGDEVPESVGGIALPRLDATLAPASRAVTDALVYTRLNPVPSSKITLLVDTSRSMASADGDDTRLARTSEALGRLVRRSPDTSVIGMYVFAEGTPGYRIAVARDGLTPAKRTALTEVLNSVTPTEDEPVNAALAAAYRDAVDNYDPTRPNSVLAVIDSDDPDTDSAAELLDAVDELSSPSTPVRVDIVVLGDDVTDTSTLQSVADRTGGTLEIASSAEAAALADILRKLAS